MLHSKVEADEHELACMGFKQIKLLEKPSIYPVMRFLLNKQKKFKKEKETYAHINCSQ